MIINKKICSFLDLCNKVDTKSLTFNRIDYALS